MPVVAAHIVRAARRGRHLSQRQLAARVGRTQSEISRLERGHQDARHDLVDLLVRGTGQTLVLVPTRRSSAAQHADRIGELLSQGNERRAWREALQLADDLAAEHGAVRVALVVGPPPPTGDDRFDALVAGIVEYRLDEERLPHPDWLEVDGPVLSSPWAPGRSAPATAAALDDAPESFRRRGIVLTADDLVSV